MDPYILVLAGFGVVVLLTAWLPMVLKELPLSLPIFCVALGFVVFRFVPEAGPAPLPLEHPELVERLTEFVVIIALMGAGLKLDRPFAWSSWSITWRLLAITMPLSIFAIGVLGWGMLGLPIAAAALLGAALAPTDPVLASDVQVGPPDSGEEDEVRFSLTSEAGLNDGLAFPFVNLAIAMALAGVGGVAAAPDGGGDAGGGSAWWALEWLGVDVVWKLAAGIGIGWLVGRALGYLTFRLPNRAKLSRTGDGFVALGVTCVAYGVTELAHGYGFLAVFVSALALRRLERSHDYHQRLHDFAEEIERLLMMLLLVLFGGAISDGLLAPLTWWGVAFGLITLLAVRPLAGLAGLAGSARPAGECAVISFFGVRGLGSFYYLAYALNETGNPFAAQAEFLWAVVGFVVLVSILVHGTTVTPIMKRLDTQRQGQQRRRIDLREQETV
jgi:NhaP-type Na+/H+ or K+/H+ antiporter